MYKELTEQEKKTLEKFPHYDNSIPDTWVGSREYWEEIFKTETNRDPKLHEAFSELHHKIIDMIVSFCKEHNLKDVDAVSISADGLTGSIDYGEWTCFTDSSMTLYKTVKDGNFLYIDREKPFLYEI